MTKLVPVILAFLPLLLRVPVAATEPVIIEDTLKGESIGTHLEYCEDRTRKATIDDIASARRGGACLWKKSRRVSPGFGYTKSAYWIRFTVTNRTAHEISWYLQQRYPLINYLSLYTPSGAGDGRYLEIRTGTRLPFSQRPLNHRTFVFPLKTAAGAGDTYYMRYESEGAMNITLHVFSPFEFNDERDSESILIWVLVGIFLIMILYNFILFFSFKEIGYLYYVLYLISFLALFLSIEGIAYQYLWPDAIWWGTFNKPIFVSMTVCTICLFMRNFAKTGELFPYIDRVFIAFIVTGMLAAVISPFISFRLAMSGTVFLTVLNAAFALPASVYLSIHKSRPGQFILASFCLFMIGAILYPLKSFGLIPDTSVTNYSIEFGAALQITILSLGLADRIHTMRIELERITQTLEDKVNERTEELLSANDEMSAMNHALIQARDEIWGEMELAKKIQTVLLPENPRVSGYDISTYMKPAQEVGGDYYDIINIKGCDWLVIGDVSGHGVPAGLIMMMVQTSIHSVLVVQPDTSPSDLLVQVNRIISENIKKLGEEKYMTITVLACIQDGRFYYSGLHQDLMIYRARSGNVEVFETDGMWLGIYSNIQGMVGDNTLTLDVGDTLLLFTDGITEARRADSPAGPSESERDMFGQDRLRDILARLGKNTTEEIKGGILKELSSYVCHDDVTMMILKRNA
ncbi:MAG TPA: 7TM diverse intracellular signaling domain-containing protein [Spirochaetota bacterium]|nr:7TM diverse intracellular signaling domain-containing protein [Spirochaetota bacterium]HPC40271.1 7TM diverse intracellular signaling domain-containing protein [Spirochaetota bacterium]HQF07254.1 7TM diverse intracellular signaling domain-containing protein [Spirochaetota bacterium]HQH96155.1 7TM diverse intracellular signaling domain-containing protein [Spirochaetota bacterium]HQJ69330.1 7TM diverse intracellular signaling domain-containing protein [Spirochaetota bacterium]